MALCRFAHHVLLTVYAMFGIYRSMYMDPAMPFSAITHDTRLRSLLLLLEHDELCVCELTHAQSVPRSAVRLTNRPMPIAARCSQRR